MYIFIKALRHIYRTIGGNKLSPKEFKLLHIDAHPDLCIPNISPSVIIDDPYGMLRLGIYLFSILVSFA